MRKDTTNRFRQLNASRANQGRSSPRETVGKCKNKNKIKFKNGAPVMRMRVEANTKIK